MSTLQEENIDGVLTGCNIIIVLKLSIMQHGKLPESYQSTSASRGIYYINLGDLGMVRVI